MSSHAVASEPLVGKSGQTDEGPSRDEALQPRGSEYLKVLAVAGAIGASLLVAPLLGMAGISLLVALFGWLVGGSPF